MPAAIVAAALCILTVLMMVPVVFKLRAGHDPVFFNNRNSATKHPIGKPRDTMRF